MLPALEPVWSEALNVWCLRVEEGRHCGAILGMDVFWKLYDPKNDPEHRITLQGVLAHYEPTHIEMLDRFLFPSRTAANRFLGEIEVRFGEYELTMETKNPGALRKHPRGS